MIIAENIHKFYDNNHILKGINLNIEEGEIVKTTLLQILGTIDICDKNYSSKLILKNKNINNLNQNQLASLRNQEIGFVFQFHQLLAQ